MNIAMLIAGGTGQRMGQEIPKQFLNVHDKPVIIYTLEAFQQHPDIDAIAVVCLADWMHVLEVRLLSVMGCLNWKNTMGGKTLCWCMMPSAPWCRRP